MKNRKFLFALLALSVTLVAVTSFAQKKEKKWTEWSKKEAQKILNESPWAQTQTETDTSQMFYSPTSDPRMTGVRETSNTGSRVSEGATNQSVNLKYYVRLFSARPIRQALARMILLENPPAEVAARLQGFAEVKAGSSIIVTVLWESNDQRAGNKAMQAFNSAITSQLKNSTYLQRSDGKQLFLEEYVPPGKDGFGARFIFLRYPGEKPFIDANTGEIRFYAEFPSKGPKVDRRFKIADMMYEGELEY